MKKNLTILLVSAIMVFSFSSLTSCGNKANESAQETPSKSGTDNGHTYIDLGLPSGTKWADRNIGASSSTDFGDYYAWGETSVKSNYSSDTYTTYKGDVAVEKWGGSWRMPLKEDFEELLKYTTNEWTTINGVNGMLCTGKNGNSIFLPAAGYRNGTSLYDAGSYGDYWSRTLSADDPSDACNLFFSSSGMFVYDNYRYCGFTIRPVCLPNQKETPPQDTLDVQSKRGTDNGHTYVDLVLPSGTKWADCNVGASSSTDYGYYFAWGETSTKSNYYWSTYKYGTIYDNLTKYCTRTDYGKNNFTDNKTELDLSDDVARQQWGGSWRMPSKEQFEELLDYTTNEWTTINGVKGRRFTGKNDNSIFLPAAGSRNRTSLDFAGFHGDYWSRTLANRPLSGIYLHFRSGDVSVNFIADRSDGLTVRPVRP